MLELHCYSIILTDLIQTFLWPSDNFLIKRFPHMLDLASIRKLHLKQLRSQLYQNLAVQHQLWNNLPPHIHSWCLHSITQTRINMLNHRLAWTLTKLLNLLSIRIRTLLLHIPTHCLRHRPYFQPLISSKFYHRASEESLSVRSYASYFLSWHSHIYQ